MSIIKYCKDKTICFISGYQFYSRNSGLLTSFISSVRMFGFYSILLFIVEYNNFGGRSTDRLICVVAGSNKQRKAEAI